MEKGVEIETATVSLFQQALFQGVRASCLYAAHRRSFENLRRKTKNTKYTNDLLILFHIATTEGTKKVRRQAVCASRSNREIDRLQTTLTSAHDSITVWCRYSSRRSNILLRSLLQRSILSPLLPLPQPCRQYTSSTVYRQVIMKQSSWCGFVVHYCLSRCHFAMDSSSAIIAKAIASLGDFCLRYVWLQRSNKERHSSSSLSKEEELSRRFDLPSANWSKSPTLVSWISL